MHGQRQIHGGHAGRGSSGEFEVIKRHAAGMALRTLTSEEPPTYHVKKMSAITARRAWFTIATLQAEGETSLYHTTGQQR